MSLPFSVSQWLSTSLRIRESLLSGLQGSTGPVTHSFYPLWPRFLLPGFLSPSHTDLCPQPCRPGYPTLTPSPASSLCSKGNFSRMPSQATFSNHSPHYWHALSPFSARFVSFYWAPSSLYVFYLVGRSVSLPVRIQGRNVGILCTAASPACRTVRGT